MSCDNTSKQQKHLAKRKSLGRKALIVIGTLSVILGTAGIFIPLLPTTPFLLLAGACFTRSSDRLYQWLLHHRWFGTYIRNYREHHAIPLATKVLALILLWSTLTYAALAVVASWLLRGLLLVIALGVTIHLLKLKTLRATPGEHQALGEPGGEGLSPLARDECEPA
ncbi:MAG: YbaN family protein [Anaerolineae bacterium]|nr:YbaN family protein [Anaerolineae bacterium]